jgi:para-nitrobenzyl esterase
MALPTNILAGHAPLLDDTLPRSVVDTFEAGDELAVPYLTGTTDLELPDSFARAIRDPARWRAELVGDRGAEAVAAYGSQAELDLHLLSDVVFTEPARHLALAHAGRAPTFRYVFGIAPRATLDELGGAPHTAEIPFVFDDVVRLGTDVPNAEALADDVADLWVDFATDGTPGEWPEAGTGRIMSFTLDGPEVSADRWEARLILLEEAQAGR